MFVPGPVRDLSVAINPKQPSVTLNWVCPDNCTHSEHVKRYQVYFGAVRFGYVDAQMTNGSVEVLGASTQVTLDRKDGLLPMLDYIFEVQAESQQGRLGSIQRATVFLGRSFFVLRTDSLTCT